MVEANRVSVTANALTGMSTGWLKSTRRKTIPLSGWQLSPAYADFDAAQRFDVAGIATVESPLCRAGEVLDEQLVARDDAVRRTQLRSPINGIVKSMVFGVICSFVALYQGYESQPTPAGVSAALPQ